MLRDDSFGEARFAPFLGFFFSLSVLSQDKCHLSSKLMYSTVLLLERGLVGWKEVCVVALALG